MGQSRAAAGSAKPHFVECEAGDFSFEEAKMDEDTRQVLSAPPVAPAAAPLAPAEARGAPPASVPGLPVAVSPPRPRRRNGIRLALLLVAMMGGLGAGYLWWRSSQSQLPPGIAWGNGRIEADEIDIETKFPGRIAEVLADEGDMVKPQQVVARMDVRELEASLHKAEAQVEAAKESLLEAQANVRLQTSQLTLAQQEFDRASALATRGFATLELLDQRRQGLSAAIAALAAANNRVGEAQRALDAATHDVELYRIDIADNSLVAPREGRIQYRIANVGEVLPAGGRVFTMLDILYVYMDIYLPTQDAGKVRIGTDARITLDAVPNLAIPAKVAFVATQAQFTPKTVETQDERDKLMFRVRVRIDPERLRSRGALVRSGLPGAAYVKWDSNLAWPAKLQGTPPP